MSTLTCADVLKEEVAVLQAQFPELADGLSRAQAVLTEGRLFVEDDGKQAMVLGSNGTDFYHVNGTCSCPASAYRTEPCKHRLSLRLYQKVIGHLIDAQRPTPPPPASNASPLPAGAFTTIQGKPFVRFEGLLALAHERGLVALETTVVQCSLDMAVYQCVATFQDGRIFTDIGDATPQNVPVKHLAPHFIRMAATRASARVLRRALNISAMAVEELGAEVGD